MKLLDRLSISTKVFLGFGIILSLLLLISVVSVVCLYRADSSFKAYRSLARQTVANGRVQANMLMTRFLAKDFVITAGRDNIDAVKARAEKTVEMIDEARRLTEDPGYLLLFDNLDQELQNYLSQFESVTARQAERDEIVHGILNVVGPRMEKNLTQIMESVFADGDAEAAYRAGITLRTMMLARLYANRFLIQNDEASYRRMIDESQATQENHDDLVGYLEDPERTELAEAVRADHRIYARAFEDVHDVIIRRNDTIRNQLDRIGPRVADNVEKLKLVLKAEQDELGPRAEAQLGRAVTFNVLVAGAAVTPGVLAAWFIGVGVSRPIRSMARGMRELAGGNMDADVTIGERSDEVAEMAEAVVVFKASMLQVRELAEERRQAEETTRQALQKAEDATRAKSDFLARMSHEIRTHMNAIIGLSHLALKTDLNPRQHDYIQKVHASAQSLLGIINDILDFSKVEADKLHLESLEFSLDEVLDNLANLISLRAQEKGLEVLFRIGVGVPSNLVGDQLRLGQVLINLCNNAVKFTEKGEIICSVDRVRETADEITLKFAVRDSGIGLSQEQIGRLFESFSQADDSTTRRYGGTGLDLAISKRLAELMGGEIRAHSEPGKGSTFEFTAVFGRTAEATEGRPVPGPDLRGMRVLVADDNREARAILTEMLESLSFKVTAVGSGEEAIRELERSSGERPYELVLMDWKMPEMDGIETTRRIRNDTHPSHGLRRS